jgi:hypothetical protein
MSERLLEQLSQGKFECWHQMVHLHVALTLQK